MPLRQTPGVYVHPPISCSVAGPFADGADGPAAAGKGTLAVRLAAHLGLRNVRNIYPSPAEVMAEDADGALHRRDPDACCDLRKVRPLDRALARWPVTISGRKRFQAATRSAIDVFEADADRLRVNPLATWTAADVRDYMAEHALPLHPLVARGYPSIGCAPCTTAVRPGEDPRAGRWRGLDKVECGIHFGPDGRIRRAS